MGEANHIPGRAEARARRHIASEAFDADFPDDVQGRVGRAIAAGLLAQAVEIDRGTDAGDVAEAVTNAMAANLSGYARDPAGGPDARAAVAILATFVETFSSALSGDPTVVQSSVAIEAPNQPEDSLSVPASVPEGAA